MILKIKTNTLDKLALSASALCVLHCLVVPISLLLFPSATLGFFGDESFHKMLLTVIIPISIVALFLGCRKHKKKSVFLYGFTGMAVLGIAAIWGHDLLGESGEIALTLMGTLTLSYAHVKNQRMCVSNKCKGC